MRPPAPNVWWGNQGRAFGNYLKIEGAPLKQARPVPPPVDRAVILFDKGKAVITPRRRRRIGSRKHAAPA